LAHVELDQMPRRVAHAITAQQRENEMLVGWVQVLLVVVLATLYFASPKTFPADAPFQPVPWALGVYACFTVWWLYLAYRGRLIHLVLMASVFVDVAVLMLTLWSFHFQYAQPAAFYLKAPTLLYIFIFIALRALSIAPGYVLLAGITAAAGWFALLGYALLQPGGQALLTRDYVEYMTSSRILLGGEIDKVLSILLVAALLTIAAARSRALLYRAISQGEALLDELGAWAEQRARRQQPAPGIGIGVTVGTVTCGAIGDANRLEYAVIGDPVNRAAKLQNHTKTAGVRALTTREALDRARSQGYKGAQVATALTARQVEGIPEPVDVVVIG
jgi:hypothetical protein